MQALQGEIATLGAAARASFRVDAHCRRCAATLERALRTTEGVAVALVLPVSRETVVDYDPALITPVDLIAAIEAAGSRVEFLGTQDLD